MRDTSRGQRAELWRQFLYLTPNRPLPFGPKAVMKSFGVRDGSRSRSSLEIPPLEQSLRSMSGSEFASVNSGDDSASTLLRFRYCLSVSRSATRDSSGVPMHSKGLAPSSERPRTERKIGSSEGLSKRFPPKISVTAVGDKKADMRRKTKTHFSQELHHRLRTAPSAPRYSAFGELQERKTEWKGVREEEQKTSAT